MNFHCWPMTWMGRTVCDVGVQIGFGPSPPPGPAGLNELVRCRRRTGTSTITVVMTIQPDLDPEVATGLGAAHRLGTRLARLAT